MLPNKKKNSQREFIQAGLEILPVFLFQIEKESLPLKASGITGQLSVCADYPVTGNDDGNGISPNGVTDSPGRCPFLRMGSGNFPGNITIGYGFAIRNFQ